MGACRNSSCSNPAIASGCWPMPRRISRWSSRSFRASRSARLARPGRSGARPRPARTLARRDRRALQPQRRAWRGSAVPQGKTLAGAAREAAVRRARLPHRSLLLFELHPGRSRHLAYGRSAHRGSRRVFRALRRGPHGLRAATLGWRVQLGNVARGCYVLRAAGGSAGRKSLTRTYGVRRVPSGAPTPSRRSPAL